MLRVEDLAGLTDAVTISRGRAYARGGRVELQRSTTGEVRAEVLGTQAYHVHLGATSWSCDCPVGVSEAVCKHVVAVVIASDAEADGAPAMPAESGPAEPNPVESWLDGLDADTLRDLLRDAVGQVPGVGELVSRAYIAATDDVTALRAEVEDVLAPRRRFYDYRQANAYAADAEPLIVLLTDRAARPSAELLEVIERAVALSVRTILRSDDSAGIQGDQIHRLLDLHADLAAGIAPTLDTKARRRLARWLHAFVFSGKQDVFEVDVDAYADALGPPGVAEYRALLEKSATAAGEDDFSVRYARGRLAVLDRDPDAIIIVIGEGLDNQYRVLAVVQALDDAHLPDLAVEHAKRGLTLAHSPHAAALVQRLVDDAAARGDTEAVLTLRRDAFTRGPTSTTLAGYAAAARTAGTWDDEQGFAETILATARPWEWIGVLLAAGRDDEAWEFAVAHPDTAASQWDQLCARRARTHPADTLPHYQRLITETLATTGRGSYLTAARLLVRLRDASTAAGTPATFTTFMAATTEANRRRPTCIDAFTRAGLIRADRTVVGT